MKKLIVLLSLMMLQLTAFSQQDTDTIPVKIFPIPTVKLIIEDIIKGDSAIAELKLVNEELELANKTIVDSREVINNLKLKHSISEQAFNYEREKYKTLESYTNIIQEDLKQEKTKNQWISIGSGSLIVFLITVLIIK
jgi:hypothetical protein